MTLERLFTSLLGMVVVGDLACLVGDLVYHDAGWIVVLPTTLVAGAIGATVGYRLGPEA